MDGSIKTAIQGSDVSVADERKIDQVVSELDRSQVVDCITDRMLKAGL